MVAVINTLGVVHYGSGKANFVFVVAPASPEIPSGRGAGISSRCPDQSGRYGTPGTEALVS